MKKGILKTLCGLMAALMLLVFAGTPVTTQAAKLPYYIKINRQQNCVTVYALDSKGKYTKPVKAFARSVVNGREVGGGIVRRGEMAFGGKQAGKHFFRRNAPVQGKNDGLAIAKSAPVIPLHSP